ncbi:MAG TPA: LptF/LptG family permease [Candidatus Barnesiella excrementigallinarum]|nr:LptF/LptG family permease [Candidatus Barnesiella excrementigallinarum]
MFYIKRLYRFILKSFLPLFLMTFFICLFIVLMQFLWRYVDEMVGKGLEMSVLAELFFYAAVTMVPMALPLAILLASLMTFGNLGERLELLAIKAAGISLLQIMRPLVIFLIFVAIGAFFFQNNVLPKSQVKMWTLLYSMRQKSPELDIPEGVFYDQISGYNLYVKKKDHKTGMLYDVMIYDMSSGFDNAMIILADSGKLKMTDDKEHLFLTLYSGESFENLRDQRTSTSNNIPYRRETFSLKEIMIAFDANFNRMDDGIMQNQYIGKDLAALQSSIDSMTQRVDSIGDNYARSLRSSGYFSLHGRSGMRMTEADSVREQKALAEAKTVDLDSLFDGGSLQRKQLYLDRAVARAERYKADYEFRSYTLTDENKVIRRHQIEMYKKFTLSFACIIFFFIGAPLGAIIRKGGLGMPVVVSVFMFIFYYIIDNSGYKLARDGRWEVWEGMWLSSAVLLPLGIFLTYKAVKDSAVFNPDVYINFFRKLIGRQELRKVVLKEVIIEDMYPDVAIEKAHRLSESCRRFLNKVGRKRQSYWKYCLYGYDKSDVMALGAQVNDLVDYVSNSNSQIVISKLMDYPVLRNLWVYRPIPSKKWGYLLAALFPIGLLLYWVGSYQQRLLRNEVEGIIHTNEELCAQLEKEESEKNEEK